MIEASLVQEGVDEESRQRDYSIEISERTSQRDEDGKSDEEALVRRKKRKRRRRSEEYGPIERVGRDSKYPARNTQLPANSQSSSAFRSKFKEAATMLTQVRQEIFEGEPSVMTSLTSLQISADNTQELPQKAPNQIEHNPKSARLNSLAMSAQNSDESASMVSRGDYNELQLKLGPSSDTKAQAQQDASSLLRSSNKSITPTTVGEHERRYRPQKYCAVCGDKAIACNFNAVTCESCKAFFRRNAFKEQRLKCLFDNRCIIDRVTRRFCSKCRLLKCFQIGMKREWILTDEQKQIKRVKMLQNKQSRQHTSKIKTHEDSPSNSDDSFHNNYNHTSHLTPLDKGNPYEPNGKPEMKRLRLKDASTSCPDQAELLNPSGRALHYCSMAAHCHYCSLRLNGGSEGLTASYMTTTNGIYSAKSNFGFGQQQYTQMQFNHSSSQAQQQHQHQLAQSHPMVGHHQPSARQADQTRVGLPPYNAVIGPTQLHSLGSYAGAHHQRSGFPGNTQSLPDQSATSSCCCLPDEIGQQHEAGNQMLAFNQGLEGHQMQPVASEQQMVVMNHCAQQQQVGGAHLVKPEGSLYASEQQHHFMGHRMISGAGCQPQSFGELNPNTGAYNYAQQYNPTKNVNPFVMALEVQPLYTTLTNQQEQKQPAMIAAGNPAEAQQGGQESDTTLVVSSSSSNSGSSSSNSSTKGSLEPHRQVPSKENKSHEHQLQISQIGRIISNSEQSTDNLKESCYELSVPSPAYDNQQQALPSASCTNNAHPINLQQQNSTQLPTTSNNCSSSAGSNQQVPNSSYLVWNGELYYEPANSEAQLRSRVESLNFNQHEVETINEMIEATRFIFESTNHENHKPNNTLNEIVYFCDAALRRLIKTVKQIKSFRMLSMDDQIILLKTACFKILILRSTYHYNTDIDGWVDNKSGKIMRLDFLKRASKSLVYERHRDLVKKFPEPLRKDRMVMSIMSLALLFDPCIDLKHSNSVKLDNLFYLSILRKYLIKIQPDPLTKYESLTNALQFINACNEEYNVFFSKDFQPEQITPLLIEIFDISINHNSIE